MEHAYKGHPCMNSTLLLHPCCLKTDENSFCGNNLWEMWYMDTAIIKEYIFVLFYLCVFFFVFFFYCFVTLFFYYCENC